MAKASVTAGEKRTEDERTGLTPYAWRQGGRFADGLKAIAEAVLGGSWKENSVLKPLQSLMQMARASGSGMGGGVFVKASALKFREGLRRLRVDWGDSWMCAYFNPTNWEMVAITMSKGGHAQAPHPAEVRGRAKEVMEVLLEWEPAESLLPPEAGGAGGAADGDGERSKMMRRRKGRPWQVALAGLLMALGAKEKLLDEEETDPARALGLSWKKVQNMDRCTDTAMLWALNADESWRTLQHRFASGQMAPCSASGNGEAAGWLRGARPPPEAEERMDPIGAIPLSDSDSDSEDGGGEADGNFSEDRSSSDSSDSESESDSDDDEEEEEEEEEDLLGILVEGEGEGEGKGGGGRRRRRGLVRRRPREGRGIGARKPKRQRRQRRMVVPFTVPVGESESDGDSSGSDDE